MNNLPSQIAVQLEKNGWFKRSFSFVDNSIVLAHLRYEKTYSNTAQAVIGNEEFTIRRRGFWKMYLEITSASRETNMQINLNWRGTLKITDAAGNPFIFKPTGFWRTRWQWFDRHNRPLVEVKSKTLSKKNRGLIDIMHEEMKDQLFWIVVSWFHVITSESDAAAVAVT